MKKLRAPRPTYAILFNGMEPIFFSPADRLGCFVAVEKDSPLTSLAQKLFPSRRILTCTKTSHARTIDSFEDFLYLTDLAQRLHANGIHNLVLPHRSSARIEQWALRNHIRLLGPSYALQQKLENKLSFDTLLARHNISKPRTLSIAECMSSTNKMPCVVQEAKSYGMFGTRFYKDCRTLNGKQNDRVLIRQYVPGIPCGISIFLDRQGNYFFSALRRQCFTYKNNFPEHFTGIQWLPSNFFSRTIKNEMTQLLCALAKTLHEEGYAGIANIDILVGKNSVFVLECNPRPSSATPQLFSVPGLSATPHPWQKYIRTFTNEHSRFATNAALPRHTYSGALLDIDIFSEHTVMRTLPAGMYALNGRHIDFMGTRVRNFPQHKNVFLLFHEVKPGQRMKADETVCTFVTNFQIFDMTNGRLNQIGHFLEQFARKNFLNP